MAAHGLDRAQAILAKHLPSRYWALDNLERYVEGTQYEDRPDWFNPQSDVPLLDRAPCIVYPIVQAAIRSNVDLCIGEGRWPTITCHPGENDAAFDSIGGLTEDQSETLDRAVEVIVDQARVKAAAREALEAGQACGSAIAIGVVRNGRIRVESTKAKWCSAERDIDGNVTRLEIRYPYIREEKDRGEWIARCYLYRRVIDAARDVTYLPVVAPEDGAEPSSWVEDKARSIDHGLGFCPVVWWKHNAGCATVADDDGRAVHEHILDEVDHLNYALSQRARAALYCGDPQLVEIGVDAGHNPSETGPPRAVIRDDKGGIFGVTGGPPARKKGPGQVWRYPGSDGNGQNTDVRYLTLPAEALKAIDDNARDLRAKIAESLAVVFTDPESQQWSGDISGRALREFHKRQLERCDSLRGDFWHGWLRPVLDVLMRIALVVGPSGGLFLPGITTTLPVLAKFARVMVGADAVVWMPAELTPLWPEYFAPTHSDEKAIVDTVVQAHTAGLITRDIALEKLRAVFPSIGTVAEVIEALDAESRAKLETAHAAMGALRDDEPGEAEGRPPAAPAAPADDEG